MKTNYFLALLSVFILGSNIHSQTVTPSPYCQAVIATLTTMYDNHIKAVNIGTLSNSTGTNYFNGSEYVYYNNITPLNLQKGTSIAATFTVSKSDIELNSFWVYIDLNMNNTFDPAELVGQAPANQLGGGGPAVPLNFSITIPSTAQIGQTRMRIIYTSDMYLVPAAPTPCNSNTDLFGGNLFAYGEIEDYNVSIVNGQTVAAPTASFTSVSTACKDQNISLTDNSTNTPTVWAWTMAGGTPSMSTVQNPVVKYASPGTYTILLASGNAGGTSAIVSRTVAISSCTGLKENGVEGSVKLEIYPNPGKGYFNVECPAPATLQVYDLCGKKLLEQSVEPGKAMIDLTAQPAGIYFMILYADGIKQHSKLIKE